jgi:hypothetical protein
VQCEYALTTDCSYDAECEMESETTCETDEMDDEERDKKPEVKSCGKDTTSPQVAVGACFLFDDKMPGGEVE